MGHLARFVIFFLGCVLLAAVLSPWLYLAVQSAAATWNCPCLDYLKGHPFHRYFNRVLQAELLLGIWWLLKQSGFLSTEALGLRPERAALFLGVGAGSSLVFMGGFALTVVALGQGTIECLPSAGRCLAVFCRVLFTAIFVAGLEELFFRGYFYQLCRREIGRKWALALNMTIFPAVHYVKPARVEDLPVADGSAGFQLLTMAFHRFADPGEIIGGCLVLMLAAWMLCWTLERTGNLYLAMGLHGGWIFALQWNGELTRCAGGGPTWMMGGGDLSQGVAALVPLVLQFGALMWWMGRRDEAPPGKRPA
ncbi:MAG: CPBP family intramembrane metalloprotease [Verrucomicrobia bacterium]|nr:CPBP family intramembrane metalloprotease [Verrucomicrobiota bacterium]